MALDFIVIGVQKGGTTSLWQHLREHPGIHMPSSKELPVFTSPSLRPDEIRAGMRELAREAPQGAFVGKATPDYMIGQGTVPVEEVVRRIAATFPEAKLVAILRDPIERAVSAHAMAARREQERRPLDDALEEELAPGALAGARREPGPTNTYVTAGEYGRILASYRRLFPAERLLVLYTEELARDPGAVLDRTLEFLGLPPGFRPDGLQVRHFRGGTRKLLDPEGERMLREFLHEEVVPHMSGSADQHHRAIDFFLETWNVVPDGAPPLPLALRARLQEHFSADAADLERLGLSAPWLERWRQGAPLGS